MCGRFLGTTPDSTTVGSLLSSIIRQLLAAKTRALVQEELPTVSGAGTACSHSTAQGHHGGMMDGGIEG